mgnify:CR=1 FL=1
MNEEERELTGAKIIGGLFSLTGLLLLIMGISQYIEIPYISEIKGTPLATYLSSVGVVSLFLYGILAIALGVGLIKEEEWAAGGTFVLLLVILVQLVSYVWYMINSIGVLSITGWIAVTIIILSVIILIYLIWASGWR